MRIKNCKLLTVVTSVAILTVGGLHSQQAWACPAEPFIGTICQVGFTFCPRGYAETNGQLLAIASNTALFSLLGTTYGGDGRTTFALPDLRGRSMVHVGQGPGLSNIRPGQRGGAEQTSLNVNNLPAHNHSATSTSNVNVTLRGTNSAGNSSTPGNNVPASKGRTDIYSTGMADVDMGASAINASATTTTTVGNTGSGVSFENRSPYLGILHCIALQGIFPSRN